MMNRCKALWLSTLLLTGALVRETMVQTPGAEAKSKKEKASYSLAYPSQPETAHRMKWFRDGTLTLQLPSDEDSLMQVIVVECEGKKIVVE